MNVLALVCTIELLAAALLWYMDTFILWVFGYIGFMALLPVTVAAWIGHFYNKSRMAQGKPKGNVLVIFAICTGICFVACFIFSMLYFNTEKPTDKFKYAFISDFFLSPILFLEFIGTLIAAIMKNKERKQQNNAPYGAYANPVNVQYNNMYQGYPGGAYPNYQSYPYQNGNCQNYPNYQNYPNGYDPNFPNNNYQNNNFGNFGGR